MEKKIYCTISNSRPQSVLFIVSSRAHCMACDHYTDAVASTVFSADTKAATGGPCRTELQHTCPVWPGVGQYKLQTYHLAGCWALQLHRARRAQRNKSRQRGRLYSPFSTKARGKKERTLSCPYTPASLHPSHHLCPYNKQTVEGRHVAL